MNENIFTIGITIGDPAGIGPEVSIKALENIPGEIIPVLIGRYDVLKSFFPAKIKNFEIINSAEDLDLKAGGKYIFNIPMNFPIPEPGMGNINSAMESKVNIDTAVKLWSMGLIDALVTAPVNKGLIEKAGVEFTGHTEYIAGLLMEKNPFMMMYSEKYRVILSTTHIPVSAISGEIGPERLDLLIDTAYKSMLTIDGGKVKIAMAGLDPHCGDDGSIGVFDKVVTLPAVERARERGIDIDGPISADALFLPEKWEKYNIAIAHYHDQGLIPFKMLAFDTGVNVTLGLTITRTSADHGTAYDIAGKNKAKYRSMEEAIKLAYRLESGRRKK